MKSKSSMAMPPSNKSPVRSLLAQMTLDEKIGQMVQPDLNAVQDRNDIQKYGFGSMLSGGDSKPPGENNPQTWLKTVNELQAHALKSRLKIPLIYGMDAVHGNNGVAGATIFPHNIGLGATRNPKLIGQAARITALETAAVGIRWTFAPCLAVVQDERWGRTYESFGQDAKLISEFGAAVIKGLQGEKLSAASDSVLACAKHFIGDGGTQGGKDQGNTVGDEAALRKIYLPPYLAAIKAGVGSIMISYNSWNGVKMHAHKYLLTGVLKGELGFKGFLVSDWAAIDQISPDYKIDVEISINAGLDMIMIPFGAGRKNSYLEFIRDLKELVAEGKVSLSRIDDAVSRILRIKFQMGLFENPYADVSLMAKIGGAEHRQVARQCVQQSLVLLKNEKSVLPLSKKIKHLAVVGKAADDLAIQCGGWTISWQGAGQLTRGTTILQAIRQTISPETQVTFSAEGNDIKNADAVVVVIGELPYAEFKGDLLALDLAPDMIALLKKVRAAGAPVTTILFSGRPLILNSVLASSDAFIAAWLPGSEGQGVADVLFGEVKPSGKLPREWPRSNDQFMSYKMPDEPLFQSGFGLTY
ncbi:MAG TPA: glycoside hydrolase family 3 N-terminal domain-containing protein [Verrucomicrobiae bacterium]